MFLDDVSKQVEDLDVRPPKYHLGLLGLVLTPQSISKTIHETHISFMALCSFDHYKFICIIMARSGQ